MTTARYTCPLCEATCGVLVTLDAGVAKSVKGDPDDVFSKGFICPKGAQLAALNTDPDRLTTPLVRDEDGVLQPASWDAAFEAVAKGLSGHLKTNRDSVALYLGNPTVHSLSLGIYTRPLIKALRTRNLYSASTVDQMPKHVSAGRMFGHPDTIPVPDLDHTQLLVVIGANPMVSNGSLCTAPDFPGRLKALAQRGGKLVVVDPKRTRTADRADTHLAIRPGTDVFLLAALVQEVGRSCGVDRLSPHCDGAEVVLGSVARFTADSVAEICGLEAQSIRDLAHELATTDRAVVYGRIGTCLSPHGTLCSWLVDVLNALIGALDSPGGALFPQPAHHLARPTREWHTGRHHSRVRNAPEVRGECPIAVLPEEILTDGDGQVRAMITVAGNPARSAPDSTLMNQALSTLDFMVSVDPYLNETTRYADVILPPPPPLSRAHYDLAFSGLAVRNVSRFVPAALPVPPGGIDEWRIMARLTAVISGYPASTPAEAVDQVILSGLAAQLSSDEQSALAGQSVETLIARAGTQAGPERLLDLLLQAGPRGLDLKTLSASHTGVDFGPLKPRLPEIISHPLGQVNLAPPEFVAQLDTLALDAPPSGLVLVGRRHLRSNNSWMHNLPKLASGAGRCALQIHPTDAEALGLADGQQASVRSAFGQLTAAVECTDRMRPGVVSLPHGWGHDAPGTQLQVAKANAGVNCNVLTGGAVLDTLSGNAWLNGVPVEVSAISS